MRVSEYDVTESSVKTEAESLVMFSQLLTFSFSFLQQFVHFAKSYNTTPSVLLTANHSTTESGNSAPVHNGITTWIEVSSKHKCSGRLSYWIINDQCIAFIQNYHPDKKSDHEVTPRDLQQGHLEC